jgi:hypothetical protein
MAARLHKTHGTEPVPSIAGWPRRVSAPLRRIVPFGVILSASLLFLAAGPVPASPSKDRPVLNARVAPNRKSYTRRPSSPRVRSRRTAKQAVHERVDSDGWIGSTDRREERFFRDLARFRSGNQEETIGLDR